MWPVPLRPSSPGIPWPRVLSEFRFLEPFPDMGEHCRFSNLCLGTEPGWQLGTGTSPSNTAVLCLPLCQGGQGEVSGAVAWGAALPPPTTWLCWLQPHWTVKTRGRPRGSVEGSWGNGDPAI